jgi:hypothetical protein
MRRVASHQKLAAQHHAQAWSIGYGVFAVLATPLVCVLFLALLAGKHAADAVRVRVGA